MGSLGNWIRRHVSPPPEDLPACDADDRDSPRVEISDPDVCAEGWKDTQDHNGVGAGCDAVADGAVEAMTNHGDGGG